MKKVLLALFALLALASCSKEANEPKGKESAGATTPIHVDVSGDVPTAKALDFSYQNGKIKAAFLEGKTEIPVWTCIFRDNDRKVIYFERVNWKVNGTKISYKGDLPIPASEIRTGGSWTYRLIAIIGGEKDTSGDRVLKYSFMQDQKIKALSTTEKFSMDLPYRMTVKLTLEQQNGRAKEFQNFTQPAADKKFKPMGCFFKFKVTNKADQAITVNAVKSVFLLYDKAKLYINIPEAGLIWDYNSYDSSTEDKMNDVRTYEFEDGALTLQPGASSAKTYYFWLPSVPTAGNYGYEGGPYPRFAFNPVRLDLVLENATIPRTKASYTATFLTQPEASYKSGSFYTGELTFRTLENPLDRLSKSPLDETGTAFVDNSIGFDATFNKVGYFTEAQVRRDFSEARTYTGGGSDQWYVPNSMEWQSIFPRALGYGGSSSNSKFNEQVQVEGLQFQSITYFKQPPTYVHDVFHVYALRFCPWDEAFRGKVQQSGAAGYLTTNQMRYAFRYRFETPSRKLIVEAKYVGDDSSIQSVEDIQDISLGGKIDWSTVTASYTFPMYGAKLSGGLNWYSSGSTGFVVGAAPERLVSAHATPIKDTRGHFLFGTGLYAHPVFISAGGTGLHDIEKKVLKPIYLFKKTN